ncbi:M23 family metallopeptidase [Amycolatopsis marina]|nr:M23 family metallopeptidase [Amycolatopsis marina]
MSSDRAHVHRRHAPLALVVTISLLLLPWPHPQAVAIPAAAAGLEPRFSWPLLPAPAVTRNFEEPAHPYGPGHRGVDLSTEVGHSVLAAGEGTVRFAGTVAGRGVVSIEHDGELRTTYEPVVPTVSTGEQIHRGQVIGQVAAGHEACPVAACLHWGALRAGEYLNPLRLVRPDTRLRLKPWEP